MISQNSGSKDFSSHLKLICVNIPHNVSYEKKDSNDNKNSRNN